MFRGSISVEESTRSSVKLIISHRFHPRGYGALSVEIPANQVLSGSSRRCGALNRLNSIHAYSIGSSPQVRGILVKSRKAPAIVGIIPAGAGHFAPLPTYWAKWSDHPRRCGALPSKVRVSQSVLGSSPQVRGTSSLSAKPRAAVGIIPAGAGHLFIRGIKPDKNGDHPRRCGALCGVGYPGSLRTGSSPQVRGTLKAVSCAIKTCRIIPAGAGHLKQCF